MSTPTLQHALPAWAQTLIALYESSAASQFVLHGNIYDRLAVPLDGASTLVTLDEFLLRVLLPRFDVVLSYDVGNGIRVEKGGEVFAQWPRLAGQPELPRTPRAAIETLTQYFRYNANLAQLGRGRTQVGCIIRDAHLIAPNLTGSFIYDLDALTLLMRDWATDSLLRRHAFATFLLCANLNDLHPMLANNTQAARVNVSLPSPDELARVLQTLAAQFPTALREYAPALPALAQQFAGATIGAVERLLKTKEYAKQSLVADDLVQLKKQLVEQECNGLIEFIESTHTLDDIDGQETVKAWMRQDLALWRASDLQAMPKGYLLCGPVGTGKTFMIECLAGEAGVPIVKLKNFRDKWVGSTEGNLETIFRLLHALGRCIVFIDEADQALGKREASTHDSGLSGRVYSMIAEEMGKPANRGKILWVLASSRPDLIEVDLKRPGRIDVKIPLFPTMSAAESWSLLRKLAQRREIALPARLDPALAPLVPALLTPGAAETLVVKLYRQMRTTGCTPKDSLRALLEEYQNPIPADVMLTQIELAVREASDLDFVPPALRPTPPSRPRRTRKQSGT